MKCPMCKGDKRIVFPTAFEYMRKHGKPAVAPCPDCYATGEVDDRMVEWAPIGQVLKDARISRHETLRAFCKRTGIDPDLRSRQERGLVDPNGVEP